LPLVIISQFDGFKPFNHQTNLFASLDILVIYEYNENKFVANVFVSKIMEVINDEKAYSGPWQLCRRRSILG